MDYADIQRMIERALAEQRPWARGKVTAVSGSAGAYKIRCTIDGEASARPVDIPCISAYSPVVNDEVILARRSANDYIALGKVF